MRFFGLKPRTRRHFQVGEGCGGAWGVVPVLVVISKWNRRSRMLKLHEVCVCVSCAFSHGSPTGESGPYTTMTIYGQGRAPYFDEQR